MLKAAQRYDESGVNLSGSSEPPRQLISAWLSHNFPELPRAVRESLYAKGPDDECGWYRLLCVEEGRPGFEADIAEAQAAAKRHVASAMKSAGVQQQPAAAAAAAAAATPEPTRMPTRSSVEHLDAAAAPAPSAPSPVPKTAPSPAAGGGGAAAAAASAQPKELSDRFQEDIAFLKFQGEMEHAMGNEEEADDGAALMEMMAQQGAAMDFAGIDLAALAETPVAVSTYTLKRDSIQDPPGFELDNKMKLTEVFPGSAAAKAGMAAAVGSCLVQVDGIDIITKDELIPSFGKVSFALTFVKEDTPTEEAAVVAAAAAAAKAAAEPAKPVATEADPGFGFVYVMGFGKAAGKAEALINAVVETDELMELKIVRDEGTALLMMVSNEAGEMAAAALHGTVAPGAGTASETLSAHLVFPRRGSKEQVKGMAASKLVNIAGFDIEVAAVEKGLGRQEKTLERWVPDDEGLEDNGATAEGWDQFEANKKLREKKGLKAAAEYSDALYSTAVDASKLTAEQREKATRLAAAMGECTEDSLADKYADGYDEEELHAAVVRDGKDQKIQSRYALLYNLGCELSQETLVELRGQYESTPGPSSPSDVLVLAVAKLSDPVKELLRKRDLLEDEIAIVRFTKTKPAYDMIQELDGQLVNDNKARVCFLYEADAAEMADKKYSAETIAVFDGKPLTFIPPLSSFSNARSLSQWQGDAGAAGASKGLGEELGNEAPAGWDQFEANEKLGYKAAEFALDAYSTSVSATDEQRARAARIAEDIGAGNKDSLLAPDGEGDGDDEEARHSAVNEVPQRAAAAAAAPAAAPSKRAEIVKPAFTEESSCYVFLRGFQDMELGDLQELFDGMGVPVIKLHLLPKYRHPIGACVIEVQKQYVVEALVLDGLVLDEAAGPLLCKMVMPPKVMDSDAFTEELDNGVILDLSFVDAQ